jgi:hypothetical protein
MYDGAGAPNLSPQGSPRALASAGRRGGQRSILCGGVRWHCRYRSGVRWCGGFRGGVRWRGGFCCCGGGDGATGPGRAKTSMLGRKTVKGLFRDGATFEGVEAKGCANDTCLAAAEPPGLLPSSRPRRRGLLGAASAAVQAFRRLTATISSLDPTHNVKERQQWRMMAKGPSYSDTAPPRRTQTRREERSSAGSSLDR